VVDRVDDRQRVVSGVVDRMVNGVRVVNRRMENRVVLGG
jgi:hypothetical protein